MIEKNDFAGLGVRVLHGRISQGGVGRTDLQSGESEG
jgi:hypothetical protein